VGEQGRAFGLIGEGDMGRVVGGGEAVVVEVFWGEEVLGGEEENGEGDGAVVEDVEEG
jgi:hypothetical protein